MRRAARASVGTTGYLAALVLLAGMWTPGLAASGGQGQPTTAAGPAAPAAPAPASQGPIAPAPATQSPAAQSPATPPAPPPPATQAPATIDRWKELQHCVDAVSTPTLGVPATAAVALTLLFVAWIALQWMAFLRARVPAIVAVLRVNGKPIANLGAAWEHPSRKIERPASVGLVVFHDPGDVAAAAPLEGVLTWRWRDHRNQQFAVQVHVPIPPWWRRWAAGRTAVIEVDVPLDAQQLRLNTATGASELTWNAPILPAVVMTAPNTDLQFSYEVELVIDTPIGGQVGHRLPPFASPLPQVTCPLPTAIDPATVRKWSVWTSLGGERVQASS